MKDKILLELSQYFNVMDLVAAAVVYFFTQRVKGIIPESHSMWRPVVAIGMGYYVAAIFATAFGGWHLVPFFGSVYAAAAIFLYDAKVVDKFGEFVRGLIK